MINERKCFWMVFVVLFFSACESYRYPDYTEDFEYTAVYFPYQELERTFVFGEFDHIQVAVQMGGRRENTAVEWADYEIDTTIEVESGLTLLPTEYYTLSDATRFPILSGDLGGELILSITKECFENSDLVNYYIPFRIVATSLDSILEDKQTMILALKVESSAFGNYYHNGILTIDSLNTNNKSIHAYHQEEPVTSAVNNWVVSTVAYDTLETSGIAMQLTGADNYSFKMVINTDNSVDIFPNASSIWNVSTNGISSYNPDKKEFYLSYKYIDNVGNNCTVADTLLFRNREIDGANQWW